jgi:hypothetical protein
MQDMLNAAFVETEHNSKTKTTIYGCAKETALVIEAQSSPGKFTVRATLKRIQHGFGSLICHLEHRSTPLLTPLIAVSGTAIVGRAVKVPR